MKITIIEGARGSGKSTLTHKLRNALTNTILINPTGYNQDSLEGKQHTVKHYDNLLTFLQYEGYDNSPFNYLFDRIFFSERVYASLYKQSYDYDAEFQSSLKRLEGIANMPGVEVQVILLTGDDDYFKRNLQREGKAHLFDKEDLADSIEESIRQQEAYQSILNQANAMTSRIKFFSVHFTIESTLENNVRLLKSLVE